MKFAFKDIVFWILELLCVAFTFLLIAEPHSDGCCCSQAVFAKLGYFRYAPDVFFALLVVIAPFVKHRILFIVILPIAFIFVWNFIWLYLDSNI